MASRNPGLVKRLLLGWVVALAAGVAWADEKILLEQVPDSASQRNIIASAKAALIKRQWTIKAADERSVTGTLDHSAYNAEITIMIKDRVLTYTENTIARMRTTGPAGRLVAQKAATPERWIAALRADISHTLATIDAGAGSSESAACDIVQRMEALADLKKKGVDFG